MTRKASGPNRTVCAIFGDVPDMTGYLARWFPKLHGGGYVLETGQERPDTFKNYSPKGFRPELHCIRYDLEAFQA